jgi:predicted acetyltransferase
VSRGIEVGPPSDEAELDALSDIQTLAFLGTPTAETRAERSGRSVPEDKRVVRVGGRVAGGLSILRLGQWFGGRRVPMAGIGGVGIAAEHRSSGAGSALMRETLKDLHTDGFALSVLYPATQPVYRRAGYEQAGVYMHLELGTQSIDVREREPELRPADKDDRDAIVRTYEERARRTSGNLDRSPRQWEFILPEADEGVRQYVVEGHEGYVSFTQRYERDGGVISCRDLVALSPRAARRLLKLFADHRSQVSRVRWHGAPGEPLLMVLAEQWHKIIDRDIWMLRVVDVRAALEARGYADGLDAELHLDVTDDVLPWNHGRFTLQISGGSARVRKGGRGRLKLDVRGLASIYTGHLSPRELLVAGLIDGPERDVAAAAKVFAGPAPWMPDFF